MKIGNRRAPFIDYTNPGIFMITMNKLKGIPAFSRLACKSTSPEKEIGVRYFDLGFIIFHTLKDFIRITPLIEIRQYVIMPDHLHILLQIREKMPKPLGDYVAIFKRTVFLEAQKAAINLTGHNSVFEPGFNDQFLRWDRNLDVIYQYIKNNPKRLWTIKQDPDYFSRHYGKIINNIKCNLFGNVSLLDNPFKSSVVIHRKDSGEELNRKKELWRYVLANGGVLVGAFISETEKEIFRGAAKYGGKLILVCNKSFEKREKPSKELFDLCAAGQLLIISPELIVPVSNKRISREECLQLNSFAENLRGGAG